ncbi:insulin-like peptide receptor [Anastrepha ludens]|uniref:insulin-like peptide receptor n=1 Tax=Anastrepha ludens TaxID=28586 RepID=UPI0023B0A41E|nr:insulin-like peptide receptor [Anastrepha ludens]XP_053957673.1 insulin-like peptide receptor [Anastrepha ludens]
MTSMSSSSPTLPATASRRQLSIIRSNHHYNLSIAHIAATARHNHPHNACNITPLSGISAPHLKLCNNKKFLLILFLCSSFLLLACNCLPRVTADTNPRIPHRRPRAEPGICTSIDVRNECESLNQLHNCTSIRGFLLIVLLPTIRQESDRCVYENYSFPLLREITDFLIFHDVKGLRNIRDMFPNLTVIRGRRLFLNYALGLTRMPDLEVLEFRSLIAIQRGHVYINNCPKLCHLDKINWDRLTLSVGENHVFSTAPEEVCPNKTVCQGCATEYCWSNNVCQRFENDNIIESKQGIQHCHSECLGGCYNSSSNGCWTCKNLIDHGACVKECPPNKYLYDIDKMCYTEDECTKSLNMTIKGNKCLLECPEGWVFDINGRDAIGCIPCESGMRFDVYPVSNLADADRIRGCSLLNASVIISIRTTINEDDLANSLSSLRNITGHLKIFRSSGLTSLKFLSSIQSISSDADLLEAGVYGLVLYDNENLKDLWQLKKLKIVHGSMYVHLNKKLCNRKLREFVRNVEHDRSKSSIQVNDQEVLCDPAVLTLSIEVLSHRSAKFSWPKVQTSKEVEIMYRAIAPNEEFVEHSELDSHVCDRVQWTRVLVFPKDLPSNDTHYSYTAEDLKPHTRYACLVKTFGVDDIYDARSDLKYIVTKMELPGPPTINVTKKTDVSLTIKLEHSSKDIVSHYVLQLYEHPDVQEVLDQRDFCMEPSYIYHEGDTVKTDEDQDTCCSRKEEEVDDQRFTRNMQTLFACDLDHKQNCAPDASTSKAEGSTGITRTMKAMLQLNLDATDGSPTTIPRLDRFHLYTIQVQSCNEIGCGAYAFHWTRTNFSSGSERLETLHACRVSDLNEFHVYFEEPKHPNGLITSYVVHFRQVLPNVTKYRSHVECVTRTQHIYNDYHVIAQLSSPFNEVAVRVYSLAGGFFTNWMPITICPFEESAIKVGSVVDHDHMVAKVILILVIFTVCAITVWAAFKWWRNIRSWWRNLALFWARQQRQRRNDDAGSALVSYRPQREEDRLDTE